VCVVLPATIDTPLFQRAANFTRAQVIAVPPVYGPERVARTLARLARHPRRETLVGTSAHLMSALWTLSPALAERLFARQVDRSHLRHDHPRAESPGNAFAPSGPEAETGGWRRPARRLRRAAAIAVPAVAAALLWRRAAG
jgi:hypothetical protein